MKTEKIQRRLTKEIVNIFRTLSIHNPRLYRVYHVSCIHGRITLSNTIFFNINSFRSLFSPISIFLTLIVFTSEFIIIIVQQTEEADTDYRGPYITAVYSTLMNNIPIWKHAIAMIFIILHISAI